MRKTSRNERITLILKRLSENPNKLISLGEFCSLFNVAKSTMSEDIKILQALAAKYDFGKVDTLVGATGGVRLRLGMSKKKARTFIQEVSNLLSDSSRALPGGFLYLSDILSNPSIVEKIGIIMAQEHYNHNPDCVLTMETKGIAIALMTAKALNVPLIIARRASKAYEGPAVNINYVAGSSNRIETMSLTRRSIKKGQRVLIVDDFLRFGGTAKGMVELMKEFEATVVGTIFAMATSEPIKKHINTYKSLMILETINNEKGNPIIVTANWLNDKESSIE